MKLTVIGTGYVGLVSSTCFASIGHDVIGVDINPEKIAALQQGQIPIYEPGLADLLKTHQARLSFTTDLQLAIKDASIIIIAVPTPSANDGSADTSAVFAVAEQIAEHSDHDAVIINKSTVPLGTAEKVQQRVNAKLSALNKKIILSVVSNPEFLREGQALDDFLQPDRIVIGVDSAHHNAIQLLKDLYTPLNDSNQKIVWMNPQSAELTKYASNAMLANRVSFINEIALIAGAADANIDDIAKGMGLDHRIGPHFLRAGMGYGGSCFPKDVAALSFMAKQLDVTPVMIDAIARRNRLQRQWMFQQCLTLFNNDLTGKKIAVWGLAFKPETDDLREAPAITLIQQLIAEGAEVIAHDPLAMDSAKQVLKNLPVSFVAQPLSALVNADCLCVCTEWECYQALSPGDIKNSLHGDTVILGRKLWGAAELQQEKLNCIAIT